MGRGIYDCRQLMHGCLNTKIPKLGGTKQGCPRALHTQLLFAAPERGLSKRRLGAFKYPADNGAHAIGAVTENEARDHSHNCNARVHLHLLHIRALGAILLILNESGMIAGLDTATFGYVAMFSAIIVYLSGGIVGSYKGRTDALVRDAIIWLALGLGIIALYLFARGRGFF